MNVKYSEHPVMFKNHPFGFILSVILIPAFGVGIIIFLVWFLKTKALKLTVTDDDILFEKGLLSKERSELSLSSVRTVKVKQTFINRIFGVGSIEIFTAGDVAEISMAGLPDPNRIRELIRAA